MTQTVTVTLPHPIARGEELIATLTLREPTAGELRGIALSQLLQGDQASLARLIERIAEPALTPAEIGAMRVANFVRVYAAVAGFFALEDQAPAA